MKHLLINEEKANFLLACIETHGKAYGSKVFKSCAIMIDEIQALFVPPSDQNDKMVNDKKNAKDG